jgi:hypothetical protein
MNKLIILMMAILAAGASQAEESYDFYGAVDFSTISAGNDSLPDSANVKFTLGTNIADNLAVEFMMGKGVNDGENLRKSYYSESSTKKGLGNFFGIYLRPFFSPTDNLEIFGRVGYFNGTVNETFSYKSYGQYGPPSVSTQSYSREGVSYGVGLAYKVAENTSVILDYMQHKTKYETFSGISAGARHYFY